MSKRNIEHHAFSVAASKARVAKWNAEAAAEQEKIVAAWANTKIKMYERARLQQAARASVEAAMGMELAARARVVEDVVQVVGVAGLMEAIKAVEAVDEARVIQMSTTTPSPHPAL
jgi:hypothetical protein